MDVGSLLLAIRQACDSCFGWFIQILNYFNFQNIYVSLFLIILCYRFLLKPLMGGGFNSSGSSDKVSKKRSSQSEGDGDTDG